MAAAFVASLMAVRTADAQVSTSPDVAAELQAVLDRGEDLLLEPGRTHTLSVGLRFTRSGQRIATRGATRPEEFAVLRFSAGAAMNLVDARGVAGASLERVILDGNRAGLVPPGGKVESVAFTAWGGRSGDRQTIRQCIIIDARCGGGWAAIHVNEGAAGTLVEDNVIVGAGVDPRGNGRSSHERPFGWGDGISIASRDGRVRNNVIVDATDDGIMVQGAPGTLVEGNAIIALSREMLGGIALIDPFPDYRMPDDERSFDYRGVIVRRNRIEALGARIHIGVALGGAGWHARFAGMTLVGATVTENTLAGEAFGYGFVANGVDRFIVRDNRSLAEHSGRGDGPRREAPEPAAAFLFDPAQIGTSELQPEFREAHGHLTNLLRAWPPPATRDGYRAAEYTEGEARGTVRMAFRDIRGRDPSVEEFAAWLPRLRDPAANGDALRAALLRESAENVAALSLAAWRSEQGLPWIVGAWRAVSDATKSERWPEAGAVASELSRGIRHQRDKPKP